MDTPHTVIELRRYRLHPGRRNELIALFEREFVETQEAAGIRLQGLFAEPGDSDRFTWLRSFADMPARARALEQFYTGPAWRTYRDAANATMIDSDDVLLLKPCPGWEAAVAAGSRQSGAGARDWLVWVAPLRTPADEALRHWVAEQAVPAWRSTGAQEMALFETEPAANNFPRLPVRTDGPVLVMLAAWHDGSGTPAQAPELPGLTQWLRSQPQAWRLTPTARSARR
ncbi:NIPSNAP family protein [Ideonella sp. DXS29W]|uniref:NIPSNAP family protein n=1 Tax=Ideonella lacteola TaxID=2984193 RepID=A0ABU9BN54_9BURK